MTLQAQELKKLIDKLASNNAPTIVHSDLFASFPFVEKVLDRNQLLENHIKTLKAVCPNDVWIPSFNYDFCKGIAFDPKTTLGQLGPLGEYYRTQYATWRTLDPVFSFVGEGNYPLQKPADHLDPFDETSLFHKLRMQNGLILFYGAPFASVTFLHYVEHLSGRPLYRYDKVFKGILHYDGTDHRINYIYHVRPMGMSLDYDWPRLLSDLERQGIAHPMRKGKILQACVFSADSLANFWLEKLKSDPLYLLDQTSRVNVEQYLEKLGRRFQISDFEAV